MTNSELCLMIAIGSILVGELVIAPWTSLKKLRDIADSLKGIHDELFFIHTAIDRQTREIGKGNKDG